MCYRNVVFPFVWPSVALVHHAEADGRNEMPFGRDIHVVPSNIVLVRGPGPLREGEIWGSEPQFAAMSPVARWVCPLFVIKSVQEYFPFSSLYHYKLTKQYRTEKDAEFLRTSSLGIFPYATTIARTMHSPLWYDTKRITYI